MTLKLEMFYSYILAYSSCCAAACIQQQYTYTHFSAFHQVQVPPHVQPDMMEVLLILQNNTELLLVLIMLCTSGVLYLVY